MGKLYVICGESGVGKTLIAKRLVAETGMVYIEEDTILIPLYQNSELSPAKLDGYEEMVALRLCMDNLRLRNSVVLVTQRYTKYKEWEEAVKKSGTNLLGELVEFYVISRDEPKHKETNSAYHYINSSNINLDDINLDDVKSLFGV